mmetsp:Transcript_14353/g.22142  ORF Transcript_14353/g.22142 Transcript_14353/m.22142 type:complete len:202 (-) Transcript_14353:3025-3630(-)
MMATASATTNELASNDKDGLPAPRRRAGGRRGVNNLNSSFIASSITKSTEQNSDDKPPSESAVAGDGAAPKRRTSIQSRRERGGSLGSNLSNSLNRSVTGIERTEGRLSVSFSDNRGLSASTIADILSGSGLDLDGPESESEKSAKEMMEEQEEAVEGRDHLGSLGGAASPRSRRRSRPQLQTIVSQRIMKFDSSDGSDEE